MCLSVQSTGSCRVPDHAAATRPAGTAAARHRPGRGLVAAIASASGGGTRTASSRSPVRLSAQPSTLNPFRPAHARRALGCLAWLLLGFALLPAAQPPPVDTRPDAAAPAPRLTPARLDVGFNQRVFTQTNRNDLEAAFRALAVVVGTKRGFAVTVTTHFYATPEDFRAAIADGAVNLVVFDSLTYVRLAGTVGVTPVFLPVSDGGAAHRYLIVTRRDGPVRSLADLRDRELIEMQAPDLSLGHAWLQQLLHIHGYEPAGAFFRSVQRVSKPSAAVLPVFFGKHAACVVDEAGFRTMCELNPQVGLQLHAIATSEPLVGTVLALNNDCGDQTAFRDALHQTLAELHAEVAGRQILTLFRIDALTPFDDALLDSVRRLEAGLPRAATAVPEGAES